MNNVDMDDLALIGCRISFTAIGFILYKRAWFHLRLGALTGLASDWRDCISRSDVDPCFDASGIKRGSC